LAVEKRNKVVEELKAQCCYFSADEASIERIGSISYQDMVFDVKLMNEYHYRYLVLSYEIEKGEHSFFSDEDVCEMNERIKELRKSLKLTQDEFGLRIGIKKSSLSQMENGIHGVTEQAVKIICREFGVREEWLRTGEGDMYPPLDRKQEIAKLTKQLLLEEEDSFKNRLISALAKLDESDWEVLAKLVDEMQKKG
jgi:transcriptional regulator with XRE-family HTH domain